MERLEIEDWVPQKLRTDLMFSSIPIGGGSYFSLRGEEALYKELFFARRLLIDQRMRPAWQRLEKEGVDTPKFYRLVSDVCKSWNDHFKMKSMPPKELEKWEKETRSLALELARKIKFTPYDHLLDRLELQIAPSYKTSSEAKSLKIERISELLEILSAFRVDELENKNTYSSILERRNKHGFSREMIIYCNQFFRDETGKPLHSITAAVLNSLMNKEPHDEFLALHIKQRIADQEKAQSRQK
jgi:hypothetical protein